MSDIAKTVSPSGDFDVRDDRKFSLLMAILFGAVFLYGVSDAIFHHESGLLYWCIMISFFGAPALFFLMRCLSNTVYLRINSNGIYHDGEFVTSWPNLLNAYIAEKDVVFTIKDNFLLVLEYLKDGSEAGFRRKIPLTSTQNRSEEEIIAAIKEFWTCYNTQSNLPLLNSGR